MPRCSRSTARGKASYVLLNSYVYDYYLYFLGEHAYPNGICTIYLKFENNTSLSIYEYRLLSSFIEQVFIHQRSEDELG